MVIYPVGEVICSLTPTIGSSDTAKVICAWSAFEDPSVADFGANSPETEGTEDSSAVGGFLGACVVYPNFSEW